MEGPINPDPVRLCLEPGWALSSFSDPAAAMKHFPNTKIKPPAGLGHLVKHSTCSRGLRNGRTEAGHTPRPATARANEPVQERAVYASEPLGLWRVAPGNSDSVP